MSPAPLQGWRTHTRRRRKAPASGRWELPRQFVALRDRVRSTLPRVAGYTACRPGTTAAGGTSRMERHVAEQIHHECDLPPPGVHLQTVPEESVAPGMAAGSSAR